MGGRRKKNVHHTERTWHSLTELKNYFIQSKVEKIKSFNGHTLVTNKATYTLGPEELHVDTGKKK